MTPHLSQVGRAVCLPCLAEQSVRPGFTVSADHYNWGQHNPAALYCAERPCFCKESDAWRCAKANKLPSVACWCKCHKRRKA